MSSPGISGCLSVCWSQFQKSTKPSNYNSRFPKPVIRFHFTTTAPVCASRVLSLYLSHRVKHRFFSPEKINTYQSLNQPEGSLTVFFCSSEVISRIFKEPFPFTAQLEMISNLLSKLRLLTYSPRSKVSYWDLNAAHTCTFQTWPD